MTTDTLNKNGEPAWWIAVYKTTAEGIRAVGLPSKSDGALAIAVPTLRDQAEQLRNRRPR